MLSLVVFSRLPSGEKTGLQKIIPKLGSCRRFMLTSVYNKKIKTKGYGDRLITCMKERVGNRCKTVIRKGE